MKLKRSISLRMIASVLNTQQSLIERVVLKHCVRGGVIGANYNDITLIKLIHHLFENYLPDEFISQFIEDDSQPTFNGFNWNNLVGNIKQLEIE